MVIPDKPWGIFEVFYMLTLKAYISDSLYWGPVILLASTLLKYSGGGFGDWKDPTLLGLRQICQYKSNNDNHTSEDILYERAEYT